MAASGPVADGSAALAEGRWEQARAAFEAALARGEAETGQACCGGELTRSFGQAGLCVTGTETHGGTARFGSVDAFVTTEVESTALRERISTGVYHRIEQAPARSSRRSPRPTAPWRRLSRSTSCEPGRHRTTRARRPDRSVLRIERCRRRR